MIKMFFCTLIALLSFNVIAGETDGTFFRSLTEQKFNPEKEGFEKLRLKYKNDKEKVALINRGEKIAWSKYESLEELNPRGFDTEELLTYKIQEARLSFLNSKKIEGLKKLDETEELINNKFQAATVASLRGSLYAQLGKYSAAIKHLTIAAHEYEGSNSRIGMLIVEYTLGVVNYEFRKLDAHEKGLIRIKKEFEKELEQYPLIRAKVRIFEGTRYYIEQEFEAAYTSVEKAIDIYIEYQDSANCSSSYMNLAFTQAFTGKMEDCFNNLKRAFDYSQKEASKRDEIQMTIGVYSLLHIDPNYTQKILELCGYANQEMMESFIEKEVSIWGNHEMKLHFLTAKSVAYESLGDDKKKYEAVEAERNFLHEIRSMDSSGIELSKYQLENQRIELDRLKLKKENAEKSNRLLKNKIEKKAREERILIIVFSLLVVSFLVSILVIRKYRNLKLQRMLEEAEKKRVKKRLEDKERQLDVLKQQIKKKTFEISKLTEENSVDDEEFKSISGELNRMKILTDNDWSRFQDLFFTLYPQLPNVLNDFNFELTEGELRMLMLLRLELSKQEIADIVGVGNEGVRKAIYRLRKKVDPLILEDLLVQF